MGTLDPVVGIRIGHGRERECGGARFPALGSGRASVVPIKTVIASAFGSAISCAVAGLPERVRKHHLTYLKALQSRGPRLPGCGEMAV